MAYLDDGGLAYFWGKIKAWANSVFALLGHTHPASDVTLMTGYSKPASGSAVAASDSLNQAVGKLEAKVDVAIDDSNYVHLTGDETIGGKKTFAQDIFAAKYIYIRHGNAVIGTAPSETLYRDIRFVDSSNNPLAWIENAHYTHGGSRLHIATKAIASSIGDYSANLNFYVNADGNTRFEVMTPEFQRNVAPSSNIFCWPLQFRDRSGTNVLGGLYYSYGTDKATSMHLMCYNGTNTSSSSYSYLSVGYDANGNWFTYAPTPSANSNGSHIATTKWVNDKGYLTSHQSLANYVTLNSDQTISAVKTFSATPKVKCAYPFVYCYESDVTCGTGVVSGVTSYGGYRFGDKNEVTMGEVIGRYYGGAGDKHYFVFFNAKNCTSSTPAAGCVVGAMYWGNGVASFMPESTNTVLLGGSSRRWKEVWCNQSSMNSSSDERLKEDIGSIPDEVLDAWEDVSWIQYRFKDANREKHGNARLHAGAIAQRVDEAFSGRGLDASRYGFFLHDEWEETPEARDADGNILQTYQAAGDEYGLRYVEALCMEAAYQRRENARLRARLASLEDRLAALELRLGSE